MWKERTEKKKFEEGFAEEIKEIYALTQDDAGSCRMKGERCWTVSMRLLAHIDGKTAELKQEKKVLQWMLSEKENEKPGKVFRLKKETIYRLKVRESLPKKTIWSNQEIPAGACLLLVDVLERNVKQPQLQEDAAAWDKKARRYAAEQLLSCAIEWQDEDEDELCADEFIRRIRIESVNVSQDGEFELYYDDGDIFAGHVIIVSGNMEKGLYDAQFAG